MKAELEQDSWYKITLSVGKVFTAYHKDGEFIFTDGSSKYSEDIVPFTESIVICDPPENILNIVDFLPDIDEE